MFRGSLGATGMCSRFLKNLTWNSRFWSPERTDLKSLDFMIHKSDPSKQNSAVSARNHGETQENPFINERIVSEVIFCDGMR